jgi:hypothetical protein
MDRIITLLCALVLAAGAMAAWDRHPPLSLPVLPFWHVALPPSLAQQRDDALAAMGRARNEQVTCLASLGQQNMEIESLSRYGDEITAKSTAALARAADENERLRAASAHVAQWRPQDGQDQCGAWGSADAAVTEALK